MGTLVLHPVPAAVHLHVYSAAEVKATSVTAGSRNCGKEWERYPEKRSNLMEIQFC